MQPTQFAPPPNSTAQVPNFNMLNQQYQNQVAPQSFNMGQGQSPQNGMTLSPNLNQQGMTSGNLQQQQQQPNALGNAMAAQIAQGSGVGDMAKSAGESLGSALGCCFIMIYGNGGFMPWFVKPLRDIAYTKEPLVRKGYQWMSNWLVPLMILCPWIEKLVKALMVQPLTEHCGYIYSVKGCKARTSYQVFWFRVWKLVGKYLVKGGE